VTVEELYPIPYRLLSRPYFEGAFETESTMKLGSVDRKPQSIATNTLLTTTRYYMLGYINHGMVMHGPAPRALHALPANGYLAGAAFKHKCRHEIIIKTLAWKNKSCD
jgi:hypothetical protein